MRKRGTATVSRGIRSEVSFGSHHHPAHLGVPLRIASVYDMLRAHAVAIGVSRCAHRPRCSRLTWTYVSSVR